jgi:gamma-glutamyl-gamma-aminobutyrate hydrolase PuuD
MTNLEIPRPKIVISQRSEFLSDRQETRDALDRRLIDWTIAIGGCPYPAPSNLNLHFNEWLAQLSPDAFILSGGNDFGEDPVRDEIEIQFLRYAKVNLKPVLGICRGMEVMGIFDGVGLKKVEGHARTRHQVISSDECTSLPPMVNSFHNWSLEKCPGSYSIIGTSSDGEIEAIRHRKLAWEGWMWHPEREVPFNNLDILRAKTLLGSNKIE